MTEADNGFLELWPTRMLQRTIPNAEQANGALLALILDQEAHYKSEGAVEDLTSDYLSQDLLSIKSPVIEWLKACINKTVADYLKQQGHTYEVKWGLQAWANINRRGDYHNLHNHPHSYLSGTYYVAVPEIQPLGDNQRQDLNPGAISFYDPRPQANMLAIRDDAQIDAEHRVQPQPGLMLLWPSFLLHLVHPNLSNNLRVSVSFNVVLKWDNHYLPE